MKKVVERVQRENETLKKSSALANQEKVAALEQENEKLKVVDHIMSYMSDTFCSVMTADVKYCCLFPGRLREAEESE